MTGQCSFCGRTMSIDAHGNLNRHKRLGEAGTRFAGSTYRQPRCDGSGNPPVAGDAVPPKPPAPYTIEVNVQLKSRSGYGSLLMGTVLLPAQSLADADEFMDLLKGKKRRSDG